MVHKTPRALLYLNKEIMQDTCLSFLTRGIQKKGLFRKSRMRAVLYTQLF